MSDHLIEDPGPIVDPGGPGGRPETDKPDPGIMAEALKIKYSPIEEVADSLEEFGLDDTDAGQLIIKIADSGADGEVRVMPGDNAKFSDGDDPALYLKFDGIDGAPLKALAEEGAFEEIDGFVFEPPGKDAAPEAVQEGLPLFIKVESGTGDRGVGVDFSVWQDLADYGGAPILPVDGSDDILG